METADRTRNCDVVVVGARCAGAATAMLLARQGHDVVLVDRADLPSDTLSTHSIARGGVVLLYRWGLLDDVIATGAPAIREVSFRIGDDVTTLAVKDRAGVDHLVAPRRHHLDAVLLDAARGAGARVHTGVTVDDVTRDGGGRVTGIAGRREDGSTFRVDSRFVVGADGLRSRIARAVDSAVVDERHSNGATFYAYFADLAHTGTEFHLGEGAVAGLFPTHGGEVNAWLCAPVAAATGLRGDPSRRERSFLDIVDEVSPSLATRLRQATRTSPVRGMSGLPNLIRRPVGSGWALVGDAGYFRDPVTGHGITDAFRDAHLLTRSLHLALTGACDEDAAMALYPAERDRMIAEFFEIAVRMAEFPPLSEFVELQRRLSHQIELEAEVLAAMPDLARTSPPPRALVAA